MFLNIPHCQQLTCFFVLCDWIDLSAFLHCSFTACPPGGGFFQIFPMQCISPCQYCSEPCLMSKNDSVLQCFKSMFMSCLCSCNHLMLLSVHLFPLCQHHFMIYMQSLQRSSHCVSREMDTFKYTSNGSLHSTQPALYPSHCATG